MGRRRQILGAKEEGDGAAMPELGARPTHVKCTIIDHGQEEKPLGTISPPPNPAFEMRTNCTQRPPGHNY